MKNSVKFTLAAMSLILAASCTKENFKVASQADNAKLVGVELNAIAEENGETKSYVNGNEIYWETGDSIAVYTTAKGDPYTFKATSVNGNKATFAGEVPAGTTDIYAVFPYPAAGGYDGTALTVTVPASQVVGEHTTAREALVAVAQGTITSALSFKNVFGLVKVNVKQNNVQAVNVKGNGLAGTVKVNATTGVITEDVARTSNATVSSATAMSKSDYYIAVLPGTTESGQFEVGVVSGESAIAGVPNVSFASPAKAVTVNRNAKLKFDTDNAAFTSSVFGIGTAAQFVAWNNAFSQWTATDKVEVYDDIDMTGVEGWVGHDFAGTFEGKGHSIKNFVVRGAGKAHVFGNVTGTISNLNFASGDVLCTEPGTETSTASIVESLSGTGSLNNIVNKMSIVIDTATVKTTDKDIIVAGIVAKLNQGSVDKCENYGRIENILGMTESAKNNFIMGGIAGRVDGKGVSIKNCLNNARLINKPTSNNLYLGGITGETSEDAGVTFSDCRNVYVITEKSQSMVYIGNLENLAVGGIVGRSSGSDIFTKCTNNSRLNNASDTITTYNMGGIIGQDLKNASTITECDNLVDTGSKCIVTAGTKGKNAYVGGIIGYTAANSSIKNCTNQCKISLQAVYSAAAEAGGLVGRISSSSFTIENSSNSGLINNNQSHTFNNMCLGGLVGHISGVACNIKNCTNTGTVQSSNKKAWTKTRFLGGIVGMANNKGVADSKIENCINNSTVEDLGIDGSKGYKAFLAAVICTAGSAGGLVIDGCQVAGTINVCTSGAMTIGKYVLNNQNYSEFINTPSADANKATVTNCSFYTGK